MGLDRFHDLSEGELIRLFREGGDDAGFAELFRRHRPLIYGGCLAFLRNTAEAEDLTQETFTTALMRIEQFRGGSFRDGFTQSRGASASIT